VAAGHGGRLVMGGSATSAAGWTHVGQAGLWVRADAVENGRWLELQGEPVAVPYGIADISSGSIDRVLMQGNLSLNDVRVERAGGSEAAEMLVEGEVLAAWLDDPYWRDVAARGDGFWQAATRPQEPLDGVVMAEQILEGPERAAGVAFVRAQIRVINTWLDDNYRADPAVVDVILDATGWSADELHGSPALLFNWEIRDGHIGQLQESLVRSGAVLYPQPLPADDLIDRSLYEEAVGAQLSG
jgi:NitT/TauT family transport system substrate-binding protein